MKLENKVGRPSLPAADVIKTKSITMRKLGVNNRAGIIAALLVEK